MKSQPQVTQDTLTRLDEVVQQDLATVCRGEELLDHVKVVSQAIRENVRRALDAGTAAQSNAT
jgi:hypothetical protein